MPFNLLLLKNSCQTRAMMISGLSLKTMMTNRLRYVFGFVLWKLLILATTQAFSSVTIPPVIKTKVRNGRTLVYRVPSQDIDQEIPSAPHSGISASRKTKTLVRRVAGDSSSSSYPSMIYPQMELEEAECKYLIT